MTVEEMTDQLHLGQDASQHALARLVAEHEIVRVSRGRYTASDPTTGGPKPHEFAIAVAPFPIAAIAGWSAAAHWQLTAQVPHEIDVAVPQEFRHPHIRSRLFAHVNVFPVPKDLWFGIEKVWVSDGEQVAMLSRQRVLIDAMLFPDRWGGRDAAREVIEAGRASKVGAQDLQSFFAAHKERLGPVRLRRLDSWHPELTREPVA